MTVEQKTILAYSIAADALLKIGLHPSNVDESLPGYFLDVDNIRSYTSLDPTEWYMSSEAVFKDIAKSDRFEIEEWLQEFSLPDPSPKDIRLFCVGCKKLSDMLTEKMKHFGVGAMAD